MSYSSNTGLRLGMYGLCAVGLLMAGCTGNSLQTADRGLDPLGDPFVALGLKADPDREIIEYGPRAPLVLPPSNELPPPQQAMAAGPDWPDDPDVRARREEADLRRAADRDLRQGRDDPSRVLSRAELDEWGRRFGRVGPAPTSAALPREHNAPASPEEMARTGSTSTVVAEPQRRRLTDPPAGYRAPVESAEAEPEEQEERRGLFSRLFRSGT